MILFEDKEPIKVALAGESGVGKTAIFRRLTEPKYDGSHTIPTIGMDLGTVEHSRHKKHYIQLWDTAGQERYNTITRNYYKQCKAVILVCDLSKFSTKEAGKYEESLRAIIAEVAEESANTSLFLIGNKSDLVSKENLGYAIRQLFGLADEFSLPASRVFSLSAKNESDFTAISDQLFRELKQLVNIQQNPQNGIRLEEGVTRNTSPGSSCC